MTTVLPADDLTAAAIAALTGERWAITRAAEHVPAFSALLRDALDLHAVPRNLARPERFANYALAEGGDARLNEWMHARLSLAVWPAPADIPVPLKDVEAAVIVHFAPPTNLDKNSGELARLSRARAEMAAEGVHNVLQSNSPEMIR